MSDRREAAKAYPLVRGQVVSARTRAHIYAVRNATCAFFGRCGEDGPVFEHRSGAKRDDALVPAMLACVFAVDIVGARA